MELQDQYVLLIGGATGMGFATAKRVDQLGGHVIIAGHNEEKNELAISQLSNRATSKYVDVIKADSIAALFSSLERIDHMFITAAPGGTGDFLSAPLDIRETYIYGKFWSLCMITQQAVPKISSTGSITFITGGFANRPTKGTVLVTAAFNAVEGFAKALTVEMAPIRFNVIRPGFIDSGFWDFMDDNEKETLFDQNRARIAVGRLGESDDIAHMATSIMTNSFLNGQVIEINGGTLPTN